MTDERLLHETTSLCRTCKDAVAARVVALPTGEVWMRKTCAEHGAQSVRLSTSAEWYERTRAEAPRPAPPRRIVRKIERGCPFDCGACESHTQRARLPVVTITSACNLDCPICYVHNKNEGAFHMGVEELKQILAHLREEQGGDIDLVNFTGGEPTLHPHFLDFIALAAEAGVHRVSVCTNGLRLRDEGLVRRLAELGARVALSFDSFEAGADYALQGAHLVETKLAVLDLLEKHDVDTTLIPVMTRGLNDQEIGRIIELGLAKRNVRHVEVHTITYTGQGGATFDRSGRISIHEVLQEIEATTGGLLTPADFVPSPCAHPLCYQIAYLLLDPEGGRPLSFARLLGRDRLHDCLSDHLYMEPGQKLEQAILDAIDRLWATGDAEATRALRILRRLLDDLFPPGGIDRAAALAVAERASKAVYVHSHMDEETFDTERVAQCCDSNCYADGSTIPVCSYNVLYRDKEERFMQRPASWGARRGGQRSFPVIYK
jgi:uncharacterized radical SAM superfamily Fe-S cluster-containing enzyme